MLSTTNIDDFHNTFSSTRIVELERETSEFCGFHLTRNKWDPYPWVTKVDEGTPAEIAGMQPGECILEINGEDIVGKRISDIADHIKTGTYPLTLLLWNPGSNPHCSPETLCCGSMPQNMQRLSTCMSTILAALECPICLDTIPPPTHQCDNGHLICLNCRTKSEKCPICRLRFSRGRSLLAEQVYNTITDVFELRNDSKQSRKSKMQIIFNLHEKNKKVPDIKITQSHTNKFLARIIGKSSSVENLSNNNMKPTVSRLSVNENFENSLKTKSLSTSEIFEPNNPDITNGNYMYQFHSNSNHSLNKFLNLERKKNNRTSYHGSLEFLEKKRTIKCGSPNTLNDFNLKSCRDEAIYSCPYNSECLVKIKESEIIQHFQISHNGPLVQYFQPKLRIPLVLLQLQKNPCYVIHIEDMTFFLRIFNVVDATQCIVETNSTISNLLIWVWLLDDSKICCKFELQVQILNSEEKILLSVTSGIYSLQKTNWKTIIDSRRGVFLNSQMLSIFNASNDHTNILLDIEILKLN